MNIQRLHGPVVTPIRSKRWKSRPWGGYQSLKEKGRFKVRHLLVTPNGRLRVQSHFHRAEHWIVVSGSGRVTVGERTWDIYENESVHIPIGKVHCLENHGKVDLQLIEVQTGSYLGDDDVTIHELPKET